MSWKAWLKQVAWSFLLGLAVVTFLVLIFGLVAAGCQHSLRVVDSARGEVAALQRDTEIVTNQIALVKPEDPEAANKLAFYSEQLKVLNAQAQGLRAEVMKVEARSQKVSDMSWQRKIFTVFGAVVCVIGTTLGLLWGPRCGVAVFVSGVLLSAAGSVASSMITQWLLGGAFGLLMLGGGIYWGYSVLEGKKQ